MCGGITATKKIAALAEANDTMIVPHNPLSPVSTAACLQIAACIPNFAIQEYPSGTPGIDKNGNLLGDEMVLGLSQHESGFIPIPSAPGIGVVLAEGCREALPVQAEARADAGACRRLVRRPVSFVAGKRLLFEKSGAKTF